jgi:hypothetical protein
MKYKRRAYIALAIVVLIGSIVPFHDVTRMLSWHPFFVLLVMAALGGAVGVIVHFAFLRISHSLFARMHLSEHNEIAGHFLGVVGVIYAVVLAFVVVTAWQQFDHTEEISLQEQRDVSALFHMMQAYDDKKSANDVVWLLLDYTSNNYREWQQMQRGELPLCPDYFYNTEFSAACPSSGDAPPSSKSTTCLTHEILETVTGLHPKSSRDLGIYFQSMSIVQNFVQDRDHRRHHYEEKPLQLILWLSFPFGALILVWMTYFVAKQDSRSQLMRTIALCAMIGLMGALALVFDNPFTGYAGIDGSGWDTMSKHFKLDMTWSPERHADPCIWLLNPSRPE